MQVLDSGIDDIEAKQLPINEVFQKVSELREEQNCEQTLLQ